MFRGRQTVRCSKHLGFMVKTVLNVAIMHFGEDSFENVADVHFVRTVLNAVKIPLYILL